MRLEGQGKSEGKIYHEEPRLKAVSKKSKSEESEKTQETQHRESELQILNISATEK
jgi:hypothetical protein